MIEWKSHKLEDAPNNWVELWFGSSILDDYKTYELNFNRCIFKIDGVVYEEATTEFKEALNKEIMFQVLQGFPPPSLKDRAKW